MEIHGINVSDALCVIGLVFCLVMMGIGVWKTDISLEADRKREEEKRGASR